MNFSCLIEEKKLEYSSPLSNDFASSLSSSEPGSTSTASTTMVSPILYSSTGSVSTKIGPSSGSISSKKLLVSGILKSEETASPSTLGI